MGAAVKEGEDHLIAYLFTVVSYLLNYVML